MVVPMDARVSLATPAAHADIFLPDAPPEACLDMPEQPLATERWIGHDEPRQGWRLATVLGPALLVAALAARQSYAMMAADGMTALEWLVLALFTLNFALVSAAAATAIIGAWAIYTGRNLSRADDRPFATSSRTAIVFPMCNEAPDAVMGAASAAYQSLLREGAADAFEFFFLSDTRDLELARAEHKTVEQLRATHPEGTFFYRRRADNAGRKAGNIADFVRRWGGRYDYMIVFDADSLMSADALTELVARMDRSPRTALIQTVPMIVNATSIFARTQQFAMRAYGQIFGAGIAWWAGHSGNFWGHNAIIRVAPFAAHADLPKMTGTGAFGGAILSHDFVEAGLLRRAGWRVEIATDIGGSYEECPPTLLDMAARDRRWVRGNMQHVALIGAKGFAPVTRMHFLSGVLGYLSSPLWFALIVSSIVLVRLAGEDQPDTAEISGRLVAATAFILFLPKILALGLWCLGRLPGWTRQTHFLGGFMFELIVSAIIAPITMVSQSIMVVRVLAGQDPGWGGQQRARSGLSIREAAAPFMPHLIVGLAVCLGALGNGVGAAMWMAPIWASLVLAAPFSVVLAKVLDGRGALARLIATPEDDKPPMVVRAARRAAARLRQGAQPGPRLVATSPQHYGPALVMPTPQQDAASA
jgi:membrane glycosyltransferase